MFTPARYIAIDDDPKELSPLIQALHRLGAPCVGIEFDPEALPSPSLFHGLRILFSDLHLLKGAPASIQHYDTLANILNLCIPETHGPYVLVLWTSHEQERVEFSGRLEQILPLSKRPIAVLALDKKLFGQAAGQWDVKGIRSAIGEQIASMPQLSALLSWERDVLAAANSTLALVGQLVPDDQRTFTAYPAALDGILSRLAEAAFGASNAPNDPRGAVTAALSPLLSDRILNQAEAPGSADLWKRAVTFPQPGIVLTDAQKAQMNRMAHLAIGPGESVNKTDWGAIIPLSAAQLEDAAMKARFGVTAAHLRDKEFKLKPDRVNDGQLVVIRGGAACDQAQANTGPLPMQLALLVPTDALQNTKRSPAVFLCREQFSLGAPPEPHSLLVHARFGTTVVQDDLPNWLDASMRLREQLLMTILVHVSAHLMRPGTLSF
ncbi:hypothetical protein [Chelativorans sp. AA-79]|uniref:hypothetical protein n=1 Tax=Chelativorans sp. AA-79 TaxID=3028735 RepID=UPI0023F783EB|nr:hypothetical protein [Chelativorans sp. AA-79]WEX09632.1 hypothetical protein PVE73_01280 [Chelativorans sp. AA-79]